MSEVFQIYEANPERYFFSFVFQSDILKMVQPNILLTAFSLIFYYIYKLMYWHRVKYLTALLLLLSIYRVAAVEQFYNDFNQGYAAKKGLTFEATIWPQESNNYVGRMSCNGCDPQQGDTSCTIKLPITCIIHAKKLSRPFYDYQTDFTSYDNPDRGFYEGWTGGIIALTDPVMGLQIKTYKSGDDLCKNAFGAVAKFASFTDGWYMDNMNGPDLKMEKTWSWGSAKSGEYNFWGYFNHNHIGRSWVWTQTTPSGNCFLPQYNPIT